MSFVVRSSLPPAQLLTELRRAIGRVNPMLAMHEVKTMNVIVGESLQLERTTSVTMTFFAIAALVMATLGIYGVVSYAVRQRTVEMGTRMALGAVGRDLLRLVVGDGLKLAGAGLALGAIAVGAGVWVLVRQLEVRDVSWLSVAFSTAIVGGVTVVASWIPAWRTTGCRRWWRFAISRHRCGSRRSVDGSEPCTASAARCRIVIEGPTSIPTTALTEFVGRVTIRGLVPDALQTVLVRVCGTLGVESAVLLERQRWRVSGRGGGRCVRAALSGHRRGRLSRRPRGRLLGTAAFRTR